MTDTRKRFNEAIAALNNQNVVAAEALFKKVLQADREHIPALNLLTVVLMSRGRFAEAEKFIERATRLNSTSDTSFYNYGLISKHLNKPQQALDNFNKAIALNPAVPETWNNRGTVFNDLGKYDSAVLDFDKAISLNDRYAEGYANKGKSLTFLRRQEEAFAAYDKALSFKPDLAEAWLGRGNLFFDLQRYDEALEAYRKALSLKPDLTEAWLGRGNLFVDLQRYEEAVLAYDRALSLKPDLAEAWLGRGNALSGLRRADEALAAYDKVLSQKPDLAEAWFGRGTALTELKRLGEAFVAYDKASSLKPDMLGAEGFRLNAKMRICNWEGFESDCEHLVESVRHNKENTDPFILLGIDCAPQDHCHCAGLWTQKRYPPVDGPSWRGERYRHSKLRIGYVSADFRQHPVANLVAGLFTGHDRSRFEVTGISLSLSDGSEIGRRLENSFDTFIDATVLGDDALAKRIREQEIDILIDLNGYTQGARTGLFARRAAPIQVNYLGYPGTMGAGYIDYIVADPTLVPVPAQVGFAEKIVYLPHSFMPHDAASRPISDRSFERAEFGLPENGFVFCCFNAATKLNPHLFGSRMKILRAVEGSVLWLSGHNMAAVNNLRREAIAAGVDPDRLVFASRVASLADHLARHRLADLFLDTLPYNAHATASDALWAGLPVLTQIGETFAGRVAASLLTAVGLPELIARSQEQFESMAIELATRPAALAALRDKLAQNRLTKPLFDTKLYTRHIESAYVTMHQRHQAGLPHDHIHVPE